MRPLSASTVIEVWERGLSQPPVERALTFLSACTEDPATLPALSVGQRDARLADMYQRLFGETLHAFAECPQCGERLEYNMAVRDLATTPALPAEEDLTLDWEEISLRLRLPDSRDLAAAGRCETVEEARALLARRCIVSAEERGLGAVPDTLPDALVERIADRLRQADPQAETLIHLTCAECSHRWQVVLDIETFLWAKVASLAKRLLREVHVLARAYGWREADILAMTAARRQFYIEMAGV